MLLRASQIRLMTLTGRRTVQPTAKHRKQFGPGVFDLEKFIYREQQHLSKRGLGLASDCEALRFVPRQDPHHRALERRFGQIPLHAKREHLRVLSFRGEGGI